MVSYHVWTQWTGWMVNCALTEEPKLSEPLFSGVFGPRILNSDYKSAIYASNEGNCRLMPKRRRRKGNLWHFLHANSHTVFPTSSPITLQPVQGLSQRSVAELLFPKPFSLRSPTEASNDRMKHVLVELNGNYDKLP